MLEDEIAEIHIGKLDCERDGNIIAPYYPCVVITAIGSVWDIKASAFICSPTQLTKMWKDEKKYFTKRAPA